MTKQSKSMAIVLVTAAFVLGGCGESETGDSANGGAGGSSNVGGGSNVGGSSNGLQWYATCGDPACQTPDPDDPNIPNCTTEVAGQPCAMGSASCELPGDSCGSSLLCTDSDPQDPGCPVSLARYKRNVRYLDDGRRKQLHDQVVTMSLASWQYHHEPPTTREHVGFMIDDVPQSVAVARDGKHVDLYGYTSMVVAALQVQAKQIEALERELDALRQSRRATCE
jgi:hypothetical protein